MPKTPVVEAWSRDLPAPYAIDVFAADNSKDQVRQVTAVTTSFEHGDSFVEISAITKSVRSGYLRIAVFCECARKEPGPKVKFTSGRASLQWPARST
jgi:hypothetical protein